MRCHVKSLLLTVFLSFFLLSCSEQDQNSSDELAAEYDKVRASEPKPEPAYEPQEEPDGVPYKLGIDYELLKKPYETADNENVVIYEFFGYTCPHCFYFEPFVQEWYDTKPQYTKLHRVPLNFQATWAVFQLGYLTAESMGIADQTHQKLFDTIHKDHKRFNSIEELSQWYAAEAQIDQNTFLSTAKSFILDSKRREADKMGIQMQVTGTPTLVVNGKYKISTKIRNRDEIINILKYLVKKEAIAMKFISQ